MPKKIVTLSIIIVTVAILGLIIYFRVFRVEKLETIKPFYEEIPEKTKTIIAGYGWSVKDNEANAVEEAISIMKEQLGKPPEFIFLFSSVGYDEEKVLQEIRKILPETKIYGGTSMSGVMSGDGFHVGEKGSLAVLGISSDRIEFGVGGADLDELSPITAGEKAVLSAIENAGKEMTEKPAIIFMTSAPGAEEKILQGIISVVGKDVPIFGGTSADNDMSGQWKQFVHDHAYANGVSLTVMYTDLKVGFAYETGYTETGMRGIASRVDGRTIYEINYRPAAEVYNEWTRGIIHEELEKSEGVWDITTKTVYHPIAKVSYGPAGQIFYLPVHPVSVDMTDGSLTVLADVESGNELSLMHGNWELFLNRFQTTPNQALITNRIHKEDGYFALYTYSARAMSTIPNDERTKMSFILKSAIGDTPFIGTFTFGEQGFVLDIENHHSNIASSMVIIAPWV